MTAGDISHTIMCKGKKRKPGRWLQCRFLGSVLRDAESVSHGEGAVRPAFKNSFWMIPDNNTNGLNYEKHWRGKVWTWIHRWKILPWASGIVPEVRRLSSSHLPRRLKTNEDLWRHFPSRTEKFTAWEKWLVRNPEAERAEQTGECRPPYKAQTSPPGRRSLCTDSCSGKARATLRVRPKETVGVNSRVSSQGVPALSFRLRPA